MVHPIGHSVGTQQQTLNPTGSTGGNSQILIPQDLNQPPTSVDALTASLGKRMFPLDFYLLSTFFLFTRFPGGGQSSPVSPVHMHHQNGFTVATVANPYNTGAPQWTGANTLTYTQSMQPPDHRHLHAASYCKLLLLLLCFLCQKFIRETFY